MANDTNYGLAAYVYTQNISRAMLAFENLRLAIVGINDINPTSAAPPFGRINDSGMGREGAKEGIEEYLEIKLGDFPFETTIDSGIRVPSGKKSSNFFKKSTHGRFTELTSF